MGRMQDDAPEVNQASIMQHFSHPHPLVEELFNLQNLPRGLVAILCSGCKLPASGTMYVCRLCNFTLHKTCAKLPQLVVHPSHPIHALTLLPIALYPGGIFSCDACNQKGNGFCFHCQTCGFDLHVSCAIKPFSIQHQLHPCQLELTLTSPYGNNKGFVCDVCSKRGSKQWLYRCKSCSFDVHLDCANATGPRVTMQPQPMVQHFNTIPGTTHLQNQFQGPVGTVPGSASMGVPLQNQILSQQPLVAGQVAYVLPNQVMHSAGTMGNQQLQHGNQLMTDAHTGATMVNNQLATGNQLMLAGPGQKQNCQPITGNQLMQGGAGQIPNYQPTTGGQYIQGVPGQMPNFQPTTGNQLMLAGPGQMPNYQQVTGSQLVQGGPGQTPNFQPTTSNQLMQGGAGQIPNYQPTTGAQYMQGVPGQMPNVQPTTGNQLMQGSPEQMSNDQTPVGTQMNQSATVGSMPNSQPQMQGNYQQPMVQDNQASMTNNIVAAAIQGIVEGGVQTAGQTLVLQMNDGGDGGNVDGGSSHAPETQN